MWGIPYPSMGKARLSLGIFTPPPHKTIQKSFCLRKQLKSFDFCKLFLYFLFIVDSYTIRIYYDKVDVILD